MSDQNTDNHKEVLQSESFAPYSRKRLRRKIRPLCDDRSSPSLYLCTPFDDLQASDDETDVVNSESARSDNHFDIEAQILSSSRQEVALELASLTAQMKGSLCPAASGPIRCRFCTFRAFTNQSSASTHYIVSSGQVLLCLQW